MLDWGAGILPSHKYVRAAFDQVSYAPTVLVHITQTMSR